ncbi:hypothetical protein K438DRAFT_1772086 [Mycena galopus ATCC 62051]|nr:hypothetical protein K438DRAFT_1772086 [Mycena galopus ATCC 62051]
MFLPPKQYLYLCMLLQKLSQQACRSIGESKADMSNADGIHKVATQSQDVTQLKMQPRRKGCHRSLYRPYKDLKDLKEKHVILLMCKHQTIKGAARQKPKKITWSMKRLAKVGNIDAAQTTI